MLDATARALSCRADWLLHARQPQLPIFEALCARVIGATNQQMKAASTTLATTTIGSPTPNKTKLRFP